MRYFINALALALLLGSAALARAETIYFLAAELPGREFHGESFVVPLSDPAHIAHARDLIEFGPEAGDTIVVAAIAPGSDGINRDYLTEDQPPWSWHIERVEGFAFATIEILDGWPGYVEEDVQRWIANTCGCTSLEQPQPPPGALGVIGFWGYTIVAELDDGQVQVPEPSVAAVLGAAVALLSLARPRR